MSDTDPANDASKTDTGATEKTLSAAARRALQEAGERRAAHDEKVKSLKARKEIDGRGGLDPVRYNDWEVKGLTSDFS